MSKFENLPICDLRDINNEEALKEIEIICNVAILIIPKDADDNIKSLIATIPKFNVAITMQLEKDALLSTNNGIVDLQDSSFSGDKSVVVANGIIIINSLSEKAKGSLIANGVVVMHESLKKNNPINFITVNGIKAYVDFEDYKVYADNVEIDAEYISYLNPKTVIIAGDRIVIKDDVTVSALKEKSIKFVSGDGVDCAQSISSYVNANTVFGG